VLALLLLAVFPQVGLADELTPAFPDTAFAHAAPRASDGPPRSYTSETARGMRSAIQIFVQAADGESVTLSVRSIDAGLQSPAVSIARLHAVPVEENTGIVSRTELFDGELNPHVIRRAPFLVFDPIEPLRMTSGKNTLQSTVTAQHGGAAFLLSCTPELAGEIEFQVHAYTGGNGENFLWQLRVHAFQLPPRKQLDFAYTNWFSPEEIAQRHGLEAWTPPFWVMLRRYAELMAHGGQDTFWLRWQDFFQQGDAGRWNLDHDRLERYVRTFLDAGFHWIEGAPIAYRPEGDWSKDWLELRFGKLPATGVEGQEALRQVASQMRSAFRTNDWSRQWIQHIADEPTDVNAADYRKLADLLRKQLPGVPIVEATMTRELAGAIDIWCPQVHKYQANREFFLERQAAGDQVWTYTCLVPGGPWLNRLLDQERLRQVYLGWAGAHFGTQGFLHWGLNHYKADPFAQSVVDHPAQPNTKNKLPAGDTHVIYPGPFGPWSSTRFEAHRIGLEDLAMLRIVQAADPERAATLIQQVFRSYDDWEASTEAYRATRAQLLSASADALTTK
jgi:hypothetical protein